MGIRSARMMRGVIRVAYEFDALALACSDPASLKGLLDGVSNEFGFGHFAVVRHVWIGPDEAGFDSVNDYPEGFEEEFVGERSYLDDPVLCACQRSLGIFRWRDATRLLPPSRRHPRLLERPRRFGLLDGVTVPAHVPGEPPSSCSFALKRGRRLSPAQVMGAQLIGLSACQAMRRLNGYPAMGRTEQLSAVQRNCLALIATGANDKRAARRLDLSPEQVADHIKKAREKFRARSRAELVMHALRDGHLVYAAPRPRLTSREDR